MVEELDDLYKIILLALDHLVAEKKKVERTYNKRVQPKSFKVGELIWKVVLSISHKNHSLETGLLIGKVLLLFLKFY